MSKSQSPYQNVKLTTTKNLLWRRVVYLSFIIIFLISAPLIILYAQGYRYNFKRGKIQKTGILIISSLPKKANVYLNEKLIVGEETPSRLEKLLPADYEIKLAKAGYHPWTKKLQIAENATTFAEDVILWKDTLAVQLASYDIIDYLASSDKTKAAFITADRKIVILDLVNQKFYDLYQVDKYANPRILGWSNTDKKILVKSGNEYLVIEAERYYLDPLIIKDDNYKSIKWNLKNDNVLHALNQAGIWSIDLFTKNKKLLWAGSADDFIIMDNILYYFYKDIIYQHQLDENKNPIIIDGIKCPRCLFLNNDLPKLMLFDSESQELFIIDKNQKNKTIKKEARALSWLNQNTFLFYNNWEIWIYESDKKEPELITRLGESIGQALWHPAGRHIIFTSEDKIKVIELDNRELRNVVELLAGQKIDHLAIDDKGKNIYFTSFLSGQSYVMSLNIK